MGEGADAALDAAMDDLDHYTFYIERYYNDPGRLYEEGIIDEHGVTIGKPWSGPYPYRTKSYKASGPGACPKCGADTVKRTGPYGAFYGCTKFPTCKGNRNR